MAIRPYRDIPEIWEGIYWLEAPIKRVDRGEGLIPYSPPLEDEALPNVRRIAQAIREVMQLL